MTEPTPKTAVTPVPAATILLVRDAPNGLEVFMVKRHHQIDFATGALVFPGGKTHAGDHDGAWEQRVLGWDRTAPEKRALRIAAIREAYEETGILLARHAGGEPFRGDDQAGEARDDVAHDRRSFLDLSVHVLRIGVIARAQIDLNGNTRRGCHSRSLRPSTIALSLRP